ncbi:proline-specific permease [[Candida] jaroonii]|uniref:Proline-specific permease n=1 Tax=[Candida] jaroonii TaxID=467808 RepID=A0ACA9YA84_9ASCO|nr:proline-specific permease [[Candida] jaroonii]
MSKETKVDVVTSNVEHYSNDLESNNVTGHIQNDGLKRGLLPRHIILISIGGVIGTGLFVGSGSALATGGPAAFFTAYLIISLVVYLVMVMLTEMATFLPLKGKSIATMGSRYVDESLAFAMGWNYWYAYNILVPTEITAAAIVVEYWTSSVPVAAWITIFLFVVIALNCMPVRIYGETEFWFASIKVIAIVGLIILGIVIFFGGAPNQHGVQGFHYWKTPGAFAQHLATGNTAKFLDVWTSLVKSAFAFVLGSELVVIGSGEAKQARRSLPTAAKTFVYRVLTFYICGSLVIGIMVPYNNPNLLTGTGNAASSPFVIGIKLVGIPVLDHIINAVILTSAWSSGNSYLYASTRALLSLADDGHAPKFFKKTTNWGVPLTIIPCGLFSLLAYLNVSSNAADAFTWFSNICTISGFFSWITISICYLRFRKAVQVQGIYDTLPYKAPFQPYGAYFILIFVSILTLTNGYAVFFDFNGSDFVAAYITLPLFFILYFGHKIYNRVVHGYTRWYIPAEEVDLVTGLDEIEAEEAAHPYNPPKDFKGKVWQLVAG